MSYEIVLTNNAHDALDKYLLDHEGDIAMCINDFGELKLLFEEIQFRSPGTYNIDIKRVSK